ncbi:hypothetical protein CkaCkLH20_04085 [Colletotrichum karsti]|uniref:Uncharacterized protein n=1 Tax=Colletotrichum karsti TaxID=1095194 RepID=A0A9P6LM94_9PEZI|nr:uncharacterized protein CkaCkLH20_04085 [Colletotrichum karsti]KAF9878593.1 hypothetical protein CkaCkLH20_04085 [Colletotrichum karsti]
MMLDIKSQICAAIDSSSRQSYDVGESHRSGHCPCSDARLDRYFQFCEAELRETWGTGSGGIEIKELAILLSRMRADPDITRETLSAKQPGDIELATRIAFMTSCLALDYSTDRLEKGGYRAEWRDTEPLSKFIEKFFEPQSHMVLSYPEHLGHADFKSDLKATKLKKVLGIVIRPTNDIRDHLKLDRKNMTLDVFHCTGFVKEHLRRSKDPGDKRTIQDALKRGALPRQLMLEVLESLQGVLFPLSDKKSRKMLASYVANGAFDPDVQNFEFVSIKNKGEETVPFYYLSTRLSELHHELLNPKPRGWLERQFERRSGARYMMMATMIGVLFAVFLGFLSLALSSYQTYIAYQAWQHPVSPD